MSDLKQTRKHGRHLRVPVLPDEESVIKENAARAGLSVAKYLRNIGIGYRITGIVDNKEVDKLIKINADLGRLGGLLKLWLTNDVRTARFGDETIRAVLNKIALTQDDLRATIKVVIRSRSDRDHFSG